jgi:hypothetical protein
MIRPWGRLSTESLPINEYLVPSQKTVCCDHLRRCGAVGMYTDC